MKLGKNWIEHPSTLNPGMYYYIHRTKRHVVTFIRDKNPRPTSIGGDWIIRLRQGKIFGINYCSPVDAMAVAGGLP